ncbi:MAG: tyrosine-type recombinase/integrase [Methylococcales bacterium]
MDVRKGHITEFVDQLILRDAKHTARNTLKLVRQMFRFAVDRDLIEFDPTAGLSITKVTTKPTERDRVLSDAEIRALAHQIPLAGLMPSTEAAIWIMLSICCRVGELSRVKLEHVDQNAGSWVIPAEHCKKGKQHTIYLSNFARTQFETLLSVTQSGVWLLPNRDNNGHVCDKSLSKQIDSHQNAAIQSHRSKLNTSLALSGGKWTPHDLRRSGATLMGNLGISPDVIEKCLNPEENKIRRIYQRQELKAE